MIWTQQEAIQLCRNIELICPPFGCHVALTGGLLYKDGPRKDCDILFYKIRQSRCIDIDGLKNALSGIGIEFKSGFGFVLKFEYGGKLIDALFPEEVNGEYLTNSKPLQPSDILMEFEEHPTR